ncbi:helix-turn-helix domain-containing protein [Paenibacillus sp. ACRRX]|uniref:ArsR/SmtB family transcription factor n=1 Tax=unclassified Paenibacillus TaxID=185978 RepID=UPI001EF71C27|nr:MULTISPECIES: helix-turn-helix domain-containing protein [unclassified Paenibacillus]MCG7409929.1 helix-turn-helix domain-containing protein [Paenibacillus sp. ACRRX]MDK8183005.1 helix-turn-helix domain-containing protein [Paenibacillus sp. UMB4589-SE434]
MRTLFHPERKDIELERVFYALSDPIRLTMVRRLMIEPELSCGRFELALPKSTLSHHFKVLREAGIMRTRVEGTLRFVSLRIEDLDDRFPGLLAIILHYEQKNPIV